MMPLLLIQMTVSSAPTFHPAFASQANKAAGIEIQRI